MKALLLCDGSEGSLRCVEAACAAPAGGPPPCPDPSLVLLHVWDAPAKHPDAAGGTHPSRMASTIQSTAVSAGGGTAAATAASEVAAAPSAEAATLGAVSSTPTLTCAEVLTATLKAIHTNKHVKGRAHYCVETVCATAVNDLPPGEDALHPGTHSSNAYLVQASTTPGLDKPDAASRRWSLMASVTAPNVSVLDGAGATGMLHSPVVRHAAACAAKHHVAAVFLGVGQRQEGKLCRVGSVAVGVLQHLRLVYPLYFMKKDGVRWRPLPANAVAATTTTSSNGGVGAAVKGPVVAAAAVTPIRFSIVVPLPLEGGSASAGTSSKAAVQDEVLASVKVSVEAAVRYVQRHCMRTASTSSPFNTTSSPASTVASVDSVGFLLIAPSSVAGNEGAGSAAAAAQDGGASDTAAGSTPDSKDVAVLNLYKQYLEALLPPIPVAHDAKEQGGDVSVPPPQPSSPPLDDGAEKAADVNSSEGAAPKPASRVTVCALKATKKNPLATLDNSEVALPQVVKQVTALKPDVLVMSAALVPESLQLAMLTTSKPHCVVLPC